MNAKKGKFIWGKDAVLALIDQYQNHPILYNLQDPDYKNKVKREAAINSIKTELLKLPMCQQQCLNEEDIKTKIHTLRSQFNKEFKKRKDSQKTGAATDELYTPSLWCYDYLLFLKDLDDVNASTCNLDNMEIPEAMEESGVLETETIFDGTIDELNENVFTPTTATYSGLRSTKPKTATPSMQKEVAKLISNATSALQEKRQARESEKDYIYTFSRSMENELRKIKNSKRLRRIKKVIMKSIFEAQEEEENDENWTV